MSDSDNTQDSAAMPPASIGSVEPVAYQAVDEYGRPFGYAQIILPFGKWPKSQRVALYRQPQPLLTDAEMDAVRFCVTASLPETEKLGGVAGELCRMHAASLRGLLERMG